ncbi:MAG: DUF58 domain-containing protein [Sedimenticolaceae bacterium]
MAANQPAGAMLNPSTQVTLAQLLELQRHAGRLDLTRRHPARAHLAGHHASRFRGRGMDYQESRNYQPGDDIRNMDWRVTARAGRPHTKLFQEERERPVIFLIDFGPSLFFATRGALKSVVAARAATLLAWAAAAQGDRIGALLFNGGHTELKPRSRHRGVLRLIHAIVEQSDPLRGLAASPHPDGLSEALVRLRRIVRPGSLVFCLSDFRTLDGNSADDLLRLRQHNDVLPIQITDPIELTVPPPGLYGVSDGDRAGILDTGSSAGQRHYREFFQGRQLGLEQLMMQRGIPLLQLSTTDDVVGTLQAQFASRRGPSAARGATA